LNRLPEIKTFLKDVVEVGGYGERVGVTWTPHYPPSLHMRDEDGNNVETAKLTSEWTVERVETYLNERGFYKPGDANENARTEL
jgi:hypothetical protein